MEATADKKKASYYLPDDLCRQVEAVAVELRTRPNKVAEAAFRQFLIRHAKRQQRGAAAPR